MAKKLRYRLKVTAPIPSWIKALAPNALTFIAWDIPQGVLDNVQIANAVLAPFNVSIDISLSL